MTMTPEEKLKAKKEREKERIKARRKRDSERKFSYKDTAFQKKIKLMYWRLEDGVFLKQLSFVNKQTPNFLAIIITFVLSIFWILSMVYVFYFAGLGMYDMNIFGLFTLSVGIREGFFLNAVLEILFILSLTLILYPTLINFLYKSNKNI